MKSRVLSLLALCSAFLPALSAAEPEIIAKARAYLGSEDALNSVTSVHLVGTVSSDNPANPKQPFTAAIDIVFQKDYEENITILYSDRLVRTALNDTEGWHEEQSPRAADQNSIDPGRQWSLTLLGPDQAKVLRVDTLENLYFYRGIEIWGGDMIDEGPATAPDGTACEKLTLVYTPAIKYHRYFDKATGRLVYSETEGGSKIQEQGELNGNGIRFAKSIVITDKGPDGKPSVKTYTFDKVTLNETYPVTYFAVPLLPPMPTHRTAEAPRIAPASVTSVPAMPAAASPANAASQPASAPAP